MSVEQIFKFEKAHVGIAEIWRVLNVKITAVRHLPFLKNQNFNYRLD